MRITTSPQVPTPYMQPPSRASVSPCSTQLWMPLNSGLRRAKYMGYLAFLTDDSYISPH